MCFLRCACVQGFLKRFWGTLQWMVFAAAAASIFTVSLVSDLAGCMGDTLGHGSPNCGPNTDLALAEKSLGTPALGIGAKRVHPPLTFYRMKSEVFALTLSLQVPFTYVEYDSNASLWPGVRRAYEAVDRYQLVNSYGLFRRMTGVGGRPEVVIEASMDRVTWTVRDWGIQSRARRGGWAWFLKWSGFGLLDCVRSVDT